MDTGMWRVLARMSDGIGTVSARLAKLAQTAIRLVSFVYELFVARLLIRDTVLLACIAKSCQRVCTRCRVSGMDVFSGHLPLAM